MFFVLGILVAGLVFGAAYSRAEMLRRTGTALARIEAKTFQPGRGPYPDTPQGHHLRYSYLVRGIRHNGATFRRWTEIDRYSPKVCYDPAQPADHISVVGWFQCGTWPYRP